jgi:hypothetical protein
MPVGSAGLVFVPIVYLPNSQDYLNGGKLKPSENIQMRSVHCGPIKPFGRMEPQ